MAGILNLLTYLGPGSRTAQWSVVTTSLSCTYYNVF